MTQLNDFKALAEICRGLALSTRERDTLAMFVEMAAEYEGMAAARALDALGGEGSTGPRPTATNGPQPFANTTIGVVATNARLAVADCLLLAQSAHDGLARAIFPAHTRFDGDAFVALATGAVDGDLDQIRVLVTAVVERAIRSLA